MCISAKHIGLMLIPILLFTACDNKNASSSKSSARPTPSAAASGASPESTPSQAQPQAATRTESTPPASTSTPSNQGPSWEVEDRVHDFGTVWTGRMIIHAFNIKNTGTAPLTLSKPKAYCSCSSADSYPEVIEPGKVGTLTYRLNMTNKAGPVHEKLESMTNDPRKPSLTFEMRGFARTVCELDVIEDLALSEGRLTPDRAAQIPKARGDFGRVKEDEVVRRVIRMKNTSGVPLDLSLQPINSASVTDPSQKTRSVPPMFEATLAVIEPGEIYDLTIVGKPPFAVGYNGTAFHFKTGIPDQPSYSFNAVAFCPPRVEITPYRIIYNERASSKRRPITITNNGSTSLRVKAVATSNPAISVTLLPQDPATPHVSVVEVLIPNDPSYVPPPYGDVVRIETTDTEHGVIEVMVLPDLNKPPTPRPPDKLLEFHPGRML